MILPMQICHISIFRSEAVLDGYPASFFRDKTLYYLVLVQFEQKKFQKAVDNFGILIEKYPLSQYAKQSLSSRKNLLEIDFHLQ